MKNIKKSSTKKPGSQPVTSPISASKENSSMNRIKDADRLIMGIMKLIPECTEYLRKYDPEFRKELQKK